MVLRLSPALRVMVCPLTVNCPAVNCPAVGVAETTEASAEATLKFPVDCCCALAKLVILLIEYDCAAAPGAAVTDT